MRKLIPYSIFITAITVHINYLLALLISSLFFLLFISERKYYYSTLTIITIFISFLSVYNKNEHLKSHSHTATHTVNKLTIYKHFKCKDYSIIFAKLDKGCEIRIRVARNLLNINIGDVLTVDKIVLTPSIFQHDIAKGICYNGTINSFNNIIVSGNISNLEIVTNKIKHKLNCQLNQTLPSSIADFLSALIFGDKEYINAELYKQLKVLCISHLVVVSGFQIVVAGIFINSLLLFIFHSYKKRKLLVLTGLFFYTCLCEFDSPVLRAFLMHFLSTVSNIYCFKLSSCESLLLSICIIIWVNPLEIYNLGLYMSALSVFGLIYIYPILEGYKNTLVKNNVLQVLLSIFTLTISSMLPLLPIQAIYFHSFSPYILLSNFILSYPIALCFIFGLLLLVFSATYPAYLLSGVTITMFKSIESSTALIYQLPESSLTLNEINIYAAFTFYCLLISLITLNKAGHNKLVLTHFLMLPLVMLWNSPNKYGVTIESVNSVLFISITDNKNLNKFVLDEKLSEPIVTKVYGKTIVITREAYFCDFLYGDIIICNEIQINKNEQKKISNKIICATSSKHVNKLLKHNVIHVLSKKKRLKLTENDLSSK
ncbi:MAG: ComEC/Rec2 family competence protein [Planctomycetes bacterium]|nr:ComEC/Rec2 family competence protein [Planctomycetota bacterium]